MKILLLTLGLAILASQSNAAEQRRFYDGSGKSLGTASTDTQGTTTYYDASGRVTAKASKSGDTTTVYDSSGKKVGTSH